MHFKGIQKQNILQSLCDGRSLHSLLASKQVRIEILGAVFLFFFPSRVLKNYENNLELVCQWCSIILVTLLNASFFLFLSTFIVAHCAGLSAVFDGHHQPSAQCATFALHYLASARAACHHQ